MVGRPNDLVKLDYNDPKYATVGLYKPEVDCRWQMHPNVKTRLQLYLSLDIFVDAVDRLVIVNSL